MSENFFLIRLQPSKVWFAYAKDRKQFGKAIIDLSCQWVIAVPLTFLTALVFNAPVAVVCLCIQSENVCKCPWGILRLRSRKWINDVTGEDT